MHWQARVGLIIISSIVGIAVYAPLISLDKPFWFRPPPSIPYEPGALAFPFFAALFDTRFFENGIDFFFNTLLVLSPLFGIAYLIARLVLRAGWPRIRMRFFLAISAVQVGLFIWIWTHPLSLPAYDYKTAIAAYIADGQTPSYLFPVFPYSFREVDVTASHPQGVSQHHPLGTDRLGRDVLTRMVYGTRVSLGVGVMSVGIYVLIGVFLGALSGYMGGKVDMLLSRFIEVMLCFPVFFLILTITAFVEQRSIFHVVLIIGLTNWTGVARLVRGEFLHQRNLDYVQAAIALGYSKARIIFVEMLPNAMTPVLVTASFGIAGAILYESGLAFLGLGDVTAPSWGSILAGGRFEFKPWLILSPGIAIFIVVAAFNLLGEALRDALDPKGKARTGTR